MMFDAAAAVTAQALASGDPASDARPAGSDTASPGGHEATVHLPADVAVPLDQAETARTAERSTDAQHPALRSVEADARPVATGEPGAATADRAGDQIVFIDTSVADYRALAAQWADRGTVVLVDAGADGLDQVRAALAGRADVAAIHIVGHGAEGVLWLGTTRIDQAAIEGDLSATLGAIGRSLEPGGDILLYGCDFAEGSDGAAALHAFAQATHADVAASTDRTGDARLGGDWTLEAHDGTIDAAALAARDWDHVLDPDSPVPIAVKPDSLTVTYNGATVVSGSTGYGSDARSPDLGVGAVARWAGVATAQGQSLDLLATVVSLSSGDAIRFNRPTAATNGDDPTFLLRDLTTANAAQVQIQWQLVQSGTTTPVAADVEFGILDIDGIGGNPFTRESVSASTTGLAYYSREKTTDIFFQSSLDQISASGTQNENTDTTKPLSTASEATFDWKNVSTWTLTYTLATNSVTAQAQFYQDGNFDFKYAAPVYTSIPRLDLDANDSTATGNDAHFTFTEKGPASAIVDTDVQVSNPMDIASVTGGAVTLTNAKPGDELLVGTLPSGITAATTTGSDGTITVTLAGTGSESVYDQAFRAITFANTSRAPDVTQRVIAVSFHNDTLTSAIATSRIDVVGVNDAPERQGSLADQASQDAATVSYATAPAFSDPDGDALSYTATGLPAGLAIDGSTGVISGTTDRSASQANGGRYAVTVTATDPSNASTTQDFTLTVSNPPPVARDDTASTNENTPVTIAVLANDSDPDGDPLTVTDASAQHGSVAINSDGTLAYTPATYFHGTDTIAYTISDGQGGTSSASVAITVAHVNQAPQPAGALADRASQDAATVSYATAPAFSDPDGDRLSYTATGLPSGLAIDGSTGVISGTIDRSASQANGGRYAVTVTATDPSNASTTQGFTLTVTNPPPVAHDDTASTDENTPVVIPVLANDSDPDGDPLTVTGASAQHGTVGINSDGTLAYTPTTYFHGTDTIAYTISDGQGGTSSASVAIAVAHVNQAPVATAIPTSYATADGQQVRVSIASIFSDPDGDPLTYSATGLPAGVALDLSTGVISGTIDRSASQANGGSYPITLTATDPSGLSASRSVALTVSNPPPVAHDDTASTDENTPVTITVLANDSDPDGDPLTVTGASAQHGSVAINPDGTLAYTPTTYFHGTDTIAYTISDGQGGTSSASVAITVAHVDQAPVAAGTLPDRATQDAAVVSYPTAAAFGDPDGDALTYAATGLPAGLAIDAATGVISGTIDRSASQASGGRYAVTVTATDPSGLAACQGFALTVANPPPVAVDDPLVSVHPGGTARIAVLANDSDPDGDPLTVTAASAGHGTVAIEADGTITYRADPSYGGTDTIVYTIGDGQGGTAGASVPVTIGDKAPTADPLPDRSASDGEAVRLPVADAFRDLDDDALTYSASGLPAGLAIDPVTGVISGTIDRSASQVNGGVYAGTVTADDGHGGIVTTPLRWTVTNPPPVAADDRATTAEDMPVTIAVLANDVDPDGDPLTVTGASAAHGTVAINGDGTITYTPAPDYDGADTIRYTIADGQGGTSSAGVAVTVTPVNDPPRAVGSLSAQAASDGGTVSFATAPGFADVDGDALTYTASGLPAGLRIDPATGVIAGRLASDASARAGNGSSVIVTATDPSGASAAQTFALALSHPAPVTANETATTPQETPVTIAVLANDASPSGAALAVTGATAGHGAVAVGPDGTIAYTPAYGFRGADTIRYTVTDAAGGTGAGEVAVTVTPVDHAPDLVAPLPAERASDGGAVRLDLGGYFTDRDGDALRYAATGLPAGLTIDPATGVIAGTLAHDASRSGPYHVTVTATDPSGASSASGFDWSIVHPAPVPQDDVAGTAANTPVAIAVLRNDRDPAGDPLTVTAATASHGVATIGADGVLQYTPGANFTGQDVVTYTVTDSDGGTATASVLVTVTPPPVARDGVAMVVPGGAVTVPVLSLASDAGGLPLAVVSVTADHGTATVNPDGSVRYVPGAGFAGTDAIRYTVADANGGTASALVAVTVALPDRSPVVPGREPVAAVGGQPLRLDLLAGVSDPDGDPVTLVDASAAVGRLAIAPDGTATYTAPLGFAGTTTIGYTVSDGRGGLTVATLVVRVADGRGADIEELLRIGRVRFLDPAPGFARVAVGADGEVRNPLSLLRTAEAIRPLGTTVIGEHPVDDAVNGARWLRGTGIDPAHPIAAEVARLDALADRRDAAGRLLDPRWGDFLVRGLTGFSAASDAKAGIMVESVVRGDALYLEVRDTAAGRQPPVRSVDVRLARGGRPEWIRVDPRGLAIVERSADRDELHLLVTVTREDGRTTTTPIVVQGATGEVELDRPSAAGAHAARPLDATLAPPHAAMIAEADRLAASFE